MQEADHIGFQMGKNCTVRCVSDCKGNHDQTVAKLSSSLAGVHAVQNYAKVPTGIQCKTRKKQDIFTTLFANSATSLMDLVLSSWTVDSSR